MNPFRGKTEGVDIDGNPRKLGDRDSMGYIIGYIDDKGNCWETLAERDAATSAGRFQDAMIAWERDGGPKPLPMVVARETCLDEANILAAAKEAREGWHFIEEFRRSLG